MKIMSASSPMLSTGESPKNDGFKWRLAEPKVFTGCASSDCEDLGAFL